MSPMLIAIAPGGGLTLIHSPFLPSMQVTLDDEGYLFITAIYFVFCFAMSRYSLWVEKQLNRSKTR